MKRIIITGATGFIGIHLIKEWIRKDAEIFAVIRPNSKNISRIPQNEKVHIIELNMNEYYKLIEQVKRADYFYHLAWEGARIPHRDNAEMQRNNYICAIDAFNCAKELNCSFFLGSGSQAEYGVVNGLVDENYECKPTTEYGKEKLHACTDILRLGEDSSIRCVWTRIFSIYGIYDFPGTLIMQSIKKMQTGETIDMTEGTQLWDYLYVEDAAKAMVLFAESGCESGIYIIASGEYKPLRDYILELKTALNSKSNLNFGAIPYGPNGPVNLMPNPNKTKETLGWSPTTSFVDGVKKIAAHSIEE